MYEYEKKILVKAERGEKKIKIKGKGGRVERERGSKIPVYFTSSRQVGK